MPRAKGVVCLGLMAMAASASQAAADTSTASSVEIPIKQTVMRHGALRYSVWVKVGDRSVEALLDTGSTGLRVLPAVVPGDLTGMPLEAGFATGETMKGLSVPARVEIGPFSATMPVEVIDGLGCRPDHPTCGYAQTNTDYLIGGDGGTGHGFSAILGIGFTAPGRDLPNPLELVGATQWIVNLPQPDDPNPGRLILKPGAAAQAPFKMHAKYESGDVYGCLRSKGLGQTICGTVNFDTGGPAVVAVTEGEAPATAWAVGTDVSLKIKGEPPLAFHVGDGGAASQVTVLPYKMRFTNEVSFINAGVYPYFFYDVLYDAAARKVGLKAREPLKPPVLQGAAVTPASAQRLSSRRSR
jgi:hypothetical protein